MGKLLKDKRVKLFLRCITILILVLIPLTGDVLPVYAQMPSPDTLLILQIEAYRNCIEPLDQLYLVSAIVSYTTPPAEYDISESFLVRLMNGGVELGSTTFYAAASPDYGYTRQLAAIYFSADTAPAWMGAYTVRVEGNPTVIWAGATPLVQSAVFSTWYDETTVSETQEALTLRLGVIGVQLENAWGALVYDLVTDTATGRKLTALGEDYFTNTIPNLISMAPLLFSASLNTPNYDENIIIQDAYMGGDNNDYDVFGTNWYAQTFTASRAYDINGVWVKVYRHGAAPGNFVISLQGTAAGLPDAADLVTGTLNGNNFSDYTDGEWEWLTFTDHYTLTSGTVYALVARATGGNVNNYVAWMVDTTGAYDGGHAAFSALSGIGGSWGALGGGTQDFLFCVTADDAYSLSYRNRLASMLIGTQFDMTNLGNNFGLSRMWMTFIVYVIFCFMITAAFDMYAVKAFKPGVTVFVFCLLVGMGSLIGAVYIEIGGLFALGMIGAGIYVLLYEKT